MGAARQDILDLIHGRDHSRIVWFDEADLDHQQYAGVEILAVERIDKSASLL